jgi:simple sugar transport system substrate-binding protein
MRVTVLYRAPETFDMVKMAQLIRAATNQRPDGLVVSIPDADALGSAIKGAVASGIPAISMNSGVDVAGCICRVTCRWCSCRCMHDTG